MDLGCVKTPKSNLRIEISSRLRQFKEQQRWRPLLGVDNRENNSARSSCAYVFTQPRPKADMNVAHFTVTFPAWGCDCSLNFGGSVRRARGCWPVSDATIAVMNDLENTP